MNSTGKCSSWFPMLSNDHNMGGWHHVGICPHNSEFYPLNKEFAGVGPTLSASTKSIDNRKIFERDSKLHQESPLPNLKVRFEKKTGHSIQSTSYIYIYFMQKQPGETSPKKTGIPSPNPSPLGSRHISNHPAPAPWFRSLRHVRLHQGDDLVLWSILSRPRWVDGTRSSCEWWVGGIQI